MVGLEPPPQGRKKLTVWLIAGGVASLLLPLLAVLYLRMTESRAVPGPSGRSDLFEHREGGEVKLTPTQTVVIPRSVPVSPQPLAEGRPAPTGGSSLDFIKPNDELRGRAGPPKAASVAAPAPPPPAEAPAAADTKTKSSATAKNGKKAFAAPKLQPSSWSSGFKSGGKEVKKGPKASGVLDPQAEGAAGGGQDMSELLKKLPPGAENDPRIQEYLRTHKQ